MFKSLRSIEESKINHSGRSRVGETMQIEGDLRTAGSIDIAGLINGSIFENNRRRASRSHFKTGFCFGSFGSVKSCLKSDQTMMQKQSLSMDPKNPRIPYKIRPANTKR